MQIQIQINRKECLAFFKISPFSEIGGKKME